MKIFDQRPSDFDFKKNEIDTCQSILNFGLLPADFSNLNYAINSFFQTYRNVNYDIITLNFHANFYMEVEGHVHHVLIGAKIEGSNAINSYYFALCDKDDDKKLIRKFHFDFAPPTIQTNQNVPVYHLQYGGKSGDEMNDLELDYGKLDRWLSLPRLNYNPMNLALLFDMLFCEFRVAETLKIVENPDWRSLILKNEKFILENYISNIYSHINSQNYSKKYLLRDLYYGS